MLIKYNTQYLHIYTSSEKLYKTTKHNKNMFKIANVTIVNNTILAPMAGVNCTAFRLQCKKYGCGLVYTQMYKVNVLLEKFKEDETGKKLKDFLNIKNIEHPIAIQLSGNVKDD